jgi:hypothetical protein
VILLSDLSQNDPGGIRQIDGAESRQILTILELYSQIPEEIT